MLRSDDVHEAVAVGEEDGIVARGVKTDGAFGMQVVNRVVKKVFAVNVLFYFYNAVQVDFYQAGSPQAVQADAFIFNLRAEVEQKSHNNGNNDDGKTDHHQQVAIAFLLLIGKKISGKAKHGQHQADGNGYKFPA